MTDRQSSLTNSQNRCLLLTTIPSETTFSIFFVTIIQQTNLCLDLIKSVFSNYNQYLQMCLEHALLFV